MINASRIETASKRIKLRLTLYGEHSYTVLSVRCLSSLIAGQLYAHTARHFGIPESKIRLTFDGKRIEPFQSLADLNIQSDDTIGIFIEQTGC